MTPTGARKIIEARLAGKRPADPVIVSFVGSLPWENPTVYVNRRRNDWRFLRGLQVMVAVSPGVDVRDEIEAIVAQAAPYVTLVEPERKLAASILSLRPVRLWPFTPRHPGWQELFA